MTPVSTIHVIDPNADTIITLKATPSIFAPRSSRKALGLAIKQAPIAQNSTTEAIAVGTPTLATAPVSQEEQGTRFRVSSRHLVLASPWFKRALTNEGWAESTRSVDDRLFHITASDWDADAFLIFLNIIHLRNRQVPRTVTLETLAKIATLVDYYECGEAVESFTETWLATLRRTTAMPTFYCRELVLWIWISWMFDMSDCFKEATAVFIKAGSTDFYSHGIPLPTKVSSKFNLKRVATV
jgi:hypothetical protein